MRAQGQTWAAIGRSLGLSRNTVIERGRRLCAQAPKRVPMPACAKLVSDDPNRAALPAGHPWTWGLLTDAEFPDSGKDVHKVPQDFRNVHGAAPGRALRAA
jgi:hypothetical protein